MNENLFCCVTVGLFLLVSTIRCDGEDAGSTSTINKNRRGSSGLISMPRVGRGNIPWTDQGADEDVAPSSTVIKSRRGSSGLIPFGRTGRGNMPWTFQISGIEYEKPKRGSSGMIPFPRVGRSEMLAHFPIPEAYFEEDDDPLIGVPGKRGGESSNEAKGMWFGPRLGKRNRRGAEFPWAVVTVKEFPGNRRYGGFTPRLGRESSEIEEEEENLLEDEEGQGVKKVRPTAGIKTHSFN